MSSKFELKSLLKKSGALGLGLRTFYRQKTQHDSSQQIFCMVSLRNSL